MDFWSQSLKLILQSKEYSKGIPPKNLYICESWETLRRYTLADNVQLPPPASLSKRVNGLFQNTKSALIMNDQELAYINTNRFWKTILLLLQKKEYVENLTKNELESLENMRKQLDETLNSLQVNLTNRYRDRQPQIVHIDIKICPLSQQYGMDLDAEIYAVVKLTNVREELETLKTKKKTLMDQINQQEKNNSGIPNKINDNVPEQLKCPVCFDIFQNKVFQCMNGHSICSTCYNNDEITACPECRVGFSEGAVRNRVAEGLVSSWIFQCPFKDRGCQAQILCRDMALHIESCIHRKSEEQWALIQTEREIEKNEYLIKEVEAECQAAFRQRSQTNQKLWQLKDDRSV